MIQERRDRGRGFKLEEEEGEGKGSLKKGVSSRRVLEGQNGMAGVFG